jgi:DNA-binding FrmR family transcriptional regulator
MLFSKKKKTKMVGKHFKHTDSQKAKLALGINKLIGQLETIKSDILTDNACDDSLIQVLAVKGGVEKIGRELIGTGILDCLADYSKEELELIFKNLLKLD